jgi:hypothetical protein
MSANRNTVKTELNRVRKLVPVLIVANVLLGLAFIVALVFALFGSGPSDDESAPRGSSQRSADPLAARADALIVGLHCPCAGCGHSRLSECSGKCGERMAIRSFVLEHLRSDLAPETVLAHVRSRFGDLTTLAGAKAAWNARHGRTDTATTLPAEGIEELPPELLQFFEQQQDGS